MDLEYLLRVNPENELILTGYSCKKIKSVLLSETVADCRFIH